VKKDTSMKNLYTSLYKASPQDKEDTYLSGYIKLNKAINQNNNFYVGSGHTVRVPDPEERYIYFVNMGKYWIGNPNLKPAQNNEFDVGFSSNYNRFSMNLDLYYRYIYDYITITQFSNPKGKIKGKINEYWNTNAYMNGANLRAKYFITDTL